MLQKSQLLDVKYFNNKEFNHAFASFRFIDGEYNCLELEFCIWGVIQYYIAHCKLWLTLDSQIINKGTKLIFNNGYVNEYLLDVNMNFSIWLQWKAT